MAYNYFWTWTGAKACGDKGGYTRPSCEEGPIENAYVQGPEFGAMPLDLDK